MAAALLVVPALITNIWQFLAGPCSGIILKRLWLMMLLNLSATIGGVLFFMDLHSTWSNFALGVTLIIYAGYAIFAPAFVRSKPMEKWLSPIVGSSTGLISGATGVFVMPVVPYLQSLQLSKDVLIQALGLSFSISSLALAIGLLMRGSFHLQQLSLSVFAILPAFIGMWVGQKIRTKISPQRFKLFFLLFLIILGVELIMRSLQSVT